MAFIKSGKAVKCSLATLTCLMLVSPLVTSGIRTVEAPEYLFTLHAVLYEGNPYWGWDGGYHDLMYAVKDELAKIGINLEIHFYPYMIFLDWDEYPPFYPGYWDQPGPPPGWDMAITEWYMLPHGLLWAWSLVLPEGIPIGGVNIMPYLNPKADKIFKKAEATIDAEERQKLLWKWQELFMHDAPMINVYYGKVYEVTAAYLEGWDPIVRFYDDSRLWLNNTEAPRPGVLTYGADEDMSSTNPMFMATYTQEVMNSLTHDCLYKATRSPWPPEINETVCDPTYPNYHKYPYVVRPDLAAAPPTYLGDGRTVIVPLRDDVYWIWPPNSTSSVPVKGPKFTADDVVFTFDAVLDPETLCEGWGDFVPVIDSVEKINDTAIQFNLRRPHTDFELLLANPWGAAIVPEHVLGGIRHGDLRRHPTNLDPSLLPGTGSYVFKECVPDDHITLEANPWYWGNQTGTIDTVIIKIMPDLAARRIALQNRDVEFCEPPVVADKSVFEEMKLLPEYKVWRYLRPASNLIILNLNNPILANRYVRMAIAHAIPYDRIRDEVLPGWGVEGIRAKTIILPYHYYKGEHLYNEELEPYEYNLTKAQQYMDMWMYSTDPTNENWKLGPVGDADQSGLVDLDDWWIWRQNIGIYSAGTWPKDIYPEWPFTVDPDFNNDNNVDLDDVWLWAVNYAKVYPFPGAR